MLRWSGASWLNMSEWGLDPAGAALLCCLQLLCWLVYRQVCDCYNLSATVPQSPASLLGMGFIHY